MNYVIPNSPMARLGKILILAGCLAGAAFHAHGTTYSFNNADGTGLWTDDGNWVGGSGPVNDGANAGNDPIYLTDTGTMVNLNVDIASYPPAGASLEVLPGAQYTITGTDNPSFNYQGSFDTGSVTYVDTSLSFLYNNASLAPDLAGFDSQSNWATANSTVLGGTGTINLFYGTGTLSMDTPDYNPANNVGPAIAPGDPTINGGIGTLTINGSINMSTASGGDQFDFVFGAAGNSLLVVTGSLTMGYPPGPLLSSTNGVSLAETFNISSLGGVTPGTYDLITYNSSEGAISSDVLSNDILNLPAGWTGALESSDGVIALNLTSTGAVPEPATYGMVLSGAVLLLGFGRFRRRRRAEA
ncbi:MAG TPA: PEP-CTERM sorting domain-containing protein [Chthoniobacteraceae bacterium]|jgi:hypothetical protein|nr:PEP-CTERM sorting domain-containing protein [Chthoniobacteraceae bacterium]